MWLEIRFLVPNIDRGRSEVIIYFHYFFKDAGVGKSCLVHRFVSDSFNASSPPTIGSVKFICMKYLSFNIRSERFDHYLYKTYKITLFRFVAY